MAEASIGEAVEKLGADTQKTRGEGLDSLRRILGLGRNTSQVEALKDEAFHGLFEALYRLVRVDRSVYLKAAKKSTAASRLTAAAAALRLAVEAGCSRIRFKTATSVLDHIVGTLPTPNNDLCEPLRNDYLKSFRTLLEYPPYGEHLRPKQWQAYVDFALTGISFTVAGGDTQNNVASSRETSMSSRVGNHPSVRPSQGSGRGSPRAGSSTSLEDLVQALRALTAITNAPILSRGAAILEGSVEFLSHATRAHEAALESINNVALVLLTEDVNLMRGQLENLTPMLRRLWSGKSQAVRDQILVTCTLCRDLFLAVGSHSELEPLLKDQLLSTILGEYRRNQSESLLQWDELSLQQPEVKSQSVSIKFAPRNDLPKAVSNWTTLTVIACLVSGLSFSGDSGDAVEEHAEHPRKRRKLQTPANDILERGLSADSQEQLIAIQVLFFLYEIPGALTPDINTGIFNLLTSLLDEDVQLNSWAMLLFSRFASSELARDGDLRQFWERVWDSARRGLAAIATTRAACVLLDTILRADLLASLMNTKLLQDSIFASGTNGPPMLADAAVLFFTDVLQSGFLIHDVSFEAFSMKVVGWLAAFWTFPNIIDRMVNAQTAFHVQPENLCPLLFAIRGAPFSYEVVGRITTLHPIRRAEAIMGDDFDFLSYYLGVTPRHKAASREQHKLSEKSFDSAVRSRLDRAVLNLLSGKIEDFQVAFNTIALGRSSNISLDVLAILATTCIVTELWRANASIPATSSGSLSTLAGQLWDIVPRFISDQKADDFAGMVAIVASRLLQLRDPQDHGKVALADAYSRCMQLLLPLTKRGLRPQVEDDGFDIEMIDSFETRTSQATGLDLAKGNPSNSRHDMSTYDLFNNSMASYTIELLLRSQTHQQYGASGAGTGISADIASNFIDQLVQLEPGQILSAQGAILDFLGPQPNISRADTSRLLERLAVTCLQDDYFERSESALCCCLKVMTCLVPVWTTDEDDDLAAVAHDMYSWYLNTALGKKIASAKVLLHISILLDTILQVNASYGAGDLPSPRTSILNIVGAAGPGLKYQLAPRLSHLFDRYVLSEHMAIFNDVVENLPSDLDKPEGIAARFHIIAELGSKWPTVLRQATYTLFETAANVPTMLRLGKACVRRMSDALNFDSPREMFRHFSPQIFYTWLENGTINTIPFEAFHYPSLLAMVTDNKIELAAQIALRGSGDQANELVAVLGSSWSDILGQAFPRAEAYCLASETSLPQSKRLCHGSESQIRKQLGTDVYIRTLRNGLPSAIAALLIAMQDDGGIEKAFEKADYADALTNFKIICSRSQSSQILPPTQQPSFRARFLIDEIQYLCSRTEIDLPELWEPALLVHLYRSLLETIVPALGPLHACMVLRKIRVVVCLGGANAQSGYPLEMLLHNLRPHLTNFHCSEDAIALYWFLLEKGIEYLQSRLSFLAGLSVAIFASLTDFIASPQDSTTQESHFLSTMSKAQEFRAWLGTYLTNIKPKDVGQESVSTFQRLMRCASSMTGAGTSSRSTQEGSLLFDLLQDHASKTPLLTDLHFELSLRILCKHFTMSPDPQDDILVLRHDATRLSPVLRVILQRLDLNDSFRIWAAQAVGRGFATTGLLRLDPQPNTEAQLSSISGEELSSVSSYFGIAKSLSELLWKDTIVTATAAERTLQGISTAVGKSDFGDFFGAGTELRLFDDLRYEKSPCPSFQRSTSSDAASTGLGRFRSSEESDTWAADLIAALCLQLNADPVLGALQLFISDVAEAAPAILPFVVHLALLAELDGNQIARRKISEVFSNGLRMNHNTNDATTKLILGTLLYLRRCKLPNQVTMAQRNAWIEIDHAEAAAGAARSKMWHAALLFSEIHQSQLNLHTSRSMRRSVGADTGVIPFLVSEVFKNVEDPDFFYGSHEDLDMSSVIQRLTHESAGYKVVSFQSAVLDSSIRSGRAVVEVDRTAFATARALDASNLHSISTAVSSFAAGSSQSAFGKMQSDTSMNLHDWNVLPNQDKSDEQDSTLETLQTLASVWDEATVTSRLNTALLKSINNLSMARRLRYNQEKHALQLAALAEAKHILSLKSNEDFDAYFTETAVVDNWTQNESFTNVAPFLEERENVFGHIRRNEQLRRMLCLSLPQTVLLEARAVRQSLQLAQHHEVPQFRLNKATYLSELSNVAASLGVKIEASSQYDLATTFWAQNEVSASIRVLQGIRNRKDLADQAIQIDRSEILTDLGQKVAEARLEKPDEIIANYLLPAFKELNGQATGSKAGRVFHNFASFCDMQLQDTDNHDDFARIAKIRERKLLEVNDLERMMKNSEGKQRDQLKQHYSKAKNWFKLDDEEWQRVQANRETLILRCLENYLLSMKACDDFPNDTLRLLSLWLDQSESAKANAAIHKHLSSVPTRKFASLMNQLSSRILNDKTDFQQLLFDLMFRICCDHPYHSLYQIFATSKSKGAQNDDVAASRYAAATKLAELIRQKGASANIWVAIHNSSIAFVRVAQEKISDKDLKTGSKLLLRNLPAGGRLISTLEGSSTKIPPPTMNIALRADRNYSSLPSMTEFQPQVSIAGGVSAPKITTVVASDGSQHKMLLKGGNDDLRQDSIMEQVFEQVSNLLKDHRATRQRKLGIRTYKVVPLYPNAGIIEFVQNTIPLHDYLLPAHTRYFPKDYKPNRCRKEISDAQTKPLQQRIQAYRTVTANFHPVMRFFFMDHFLDPDEWFQKRLNYSRSTAAISILGHVLGLGDRHGHNILLDENSGEVVHIDLGVAFEAGRVLPVPEVVPFRLTRDLVDGMGISGVEGVFRRCCNFTLEALRREQEAIMTILDVLRYDPLYSWSVSPLRLQRMQENNEQAAAAAANSGIIGADGVGPGGPGRRDVGEPNEADRALTVVAKKLGKSLSVEATVNELIRQATDERNLAVLYCGWAAYA